MYNYETDNSLISFINSKGKLEFREIFASQSFHFKVSCSRVKIVISHTFLDSVCMNLPHSFTLKLYNVSDQSSNSSPTQAFATFKIDFGKLYDTLSSTLKEDQTTLLMYLLMHRNTSIKSYFLSRTNLDHLVSAYISALGGCGFYCLMLTLSQQNTTFFVVVVVYLFYVDC